MRILVLSEGNAETADSWSGSSKSLVDHLRARGHTVVCGDVEPTGPSKLITALRSFAYPRRRWWVRYHLGAMGFRIRCRNAERLFSAHRENIDVVVQIGATFEVAATRGVPYVLFCDSNIELAREGIASGFSDANHLGPKELEAVWERERRFYQRVSRIFTMSDRLRRTFIETFSIPQERVQTVYPGPNLRVGAVQQGAVSAERSSPTVLFIGRDFERKGGNELLRAFERVRLQMPEARLVLIGPGVRPATLPPDSPGIDFWGYVDTSSPVGREKLASAYAGARVFCLPTRFEPFGIVFLEAMRYALPCVGPRLWAVPEIVEDGVTGLLFAPDDVDGLASCLLELLQSPERAVQMGAAGRRRLESQFSWDLLAETMEHALRDLSTESGGDARLPNRPNHPQHLPLEDTE